MTSSAASDFPIVGAITTLIVLTVVILVVVIAAGIHPWRWGAPWPRRRTRIQQAAAADVAELREFDQYDPDGPGLQEEEDL